MSCNKCDEYNNPCTCSSCTETVLPCDCAVKDISTDCSLYNGDDLECSGISKGSSLTQVIIKLDKFICDKFSEVSQYLSLVNLGTGAKIYKGISGIGQKEIRSIVSSDSSITVLENESEIDITTSGTSGEANTASNQGGQVELFKQKNLTDLEFRTLQGVGSTTVSQNGDIVQIDSTGEANTASNVGAGVGVYKQKVGVDNELKTLLGGTNVTITSTADEITINSTGGGAIEAGQIERTVSFTLDSSMNNQVIFANGSDLSVIDITIPTGLPNDFKCGVIRQGGASVNFVSGTGVTANTATGTQIESRYYQGFVQKRNSGTDEYVLLGNLI